MDIKEQTTLPVVQLNYTDIETGIQYLRDKYEGLVFEEKDLKDAKKDMADLNKISKVLTDTAKKIKTNILQSVEQPINALNNYASQVLDIRELIKKQHDVYVDAQKQAKTEEIMSLIKGRLAFHSLPLDTTIEFDNRWLANDKNMTYITNCVDNIILKVKIEQQNAILLENARIDRIKLIDSIVQDNNECGKYDFILGSITFHVEPYLSCSTEEMENAIYKAFEDEKARRTPKPEIVKTKPIPAQSQVLKPTQEPIKIHKWSFTISFNDSNGSKIKNYLDIIKNLSVEFNAKNLT